MPKLLILITEDWFFVSHFLPMARAARAAGFDVSVATRAVNHGQRIEDEGFRLIPFPWRRQSSRVMALSREVIAARRLIAEQEPDVVHAIALRPVLIAGLARLGLPVRRTILAVTGRGVLDIATGTARLGQWLVYGLIRRLAASNSVQFLFENVDDAQALGFSSTSDPRMVLVGGAGIDPDKYQQQPAPPFPPLRAAVVARMIRSKGIDHAVEAVLRARRSGIAVELDLYGEPDPLNPQSFTRAELEKWSSLEGIRWHGRIDDVAGVWRNAHVALVPSRGGEGLPRSLLEAAACGRPIIASNVPGCRDFVRDGNEGLLVAPNDANALADALRWLAEAPERIVAMGAAARSRVLDGFTEQHVQAVVTRLYREALDP